MIDDPRELAKEIADAIRDRPEVICRDCAMRGFAVDALGESVETASSRAVAFSIEGLCSRPALVGKATEEASAQLIDLVAAETKVGIDLWFGWGERTPEQVEALFRSVAEGQ